MSDAAIQLISLTSFVLTLLGFMVLTEWGNRQ